MQKRSRVTIFLIGLVIFFQFSFSMKCVDPSEDDHTIPILYATREGGHFSAPERDANLDKGQIMTCAWKIIPEQDHLELSFFNLKLDFNDDCVDEYISLHYGDKLDDSTLVSKFCGTQGQQFGFKPGVHVTIYFSTKFESFAFKVEYKIVPTKPQVQPESIWDVTDLTTILPFIPLIVFVAFFLCIFCSFMKQIKNRAFPNRISTRGGVQDFRQNVATTQTAVDSSYPREPPPPYPGLPAVQFPADEYHGNRETRSVGDNPAYTSPVNYYYPTRTVIPRNSTRNAPIATCRLV